FQPALTESPSGFTGVNLGTEMFAVAGLLFALARREHNRQVAHSIGVNLGTEREVMLFAVALQFNNEAGCGLFIHRQASRLLVLEINIREPAGRCGRARQNRRLVPIDGPEWWEVEPSELSNCSRPLHFSHRSVSGLSHGR